VYFAHIPTVEFISAHRLVSGPGAKGIEGDGGAGWYQDPESIEKRRSNLTTLAIANSNVSVDVIAMLVSKCKKLKRFEYEYEHGEARVRHNVKNVNRGMMDALGQFCGHSLERLVLEDEQGLYVSAGLSRNIVTLTIARKSGILCFLQRTWKS